MYYASNLDVLKDAGEQSILISFHNYITRQKATEVN